MKNLIQHPIAARLVSLSVAWFIYFGSAVSQTLLPPTFDSSYIESFPKSVIGRIFLSQKYTNLELKKGNDAPRVRYLSNNKINAGIGATYQGLSVNISYGAGSVNENRGETKSLDLQSRLYSRKWAIDLIGQFYKGYYLDPNGRGNNKDNSYYLRPDINVNLAGMSAYKIYNYRKFTLRPAFVQDEVQKKSAGTFLTGLEAYYSDLHSDVDSSLVPSPLVTFYDNRGIRRVRYVKIGPGAGYAYTQVLPLHLFITASLTANVNLAYVQETGISSGLKNHFSVNANLIYRLAAGYSNGNWNVSAFWINNRNPTRGASSGNDYLLHAGNYRLILAKRIQPGKRTKNFLDKYFRPF
ncbi:MAG: DUF4421 domain-containing protein [Chitinophagaceae bacterium]